MFQHGTRLFPGSLFEQPFYCRYEAQQDFFRAFYSTPLRWLMQFTLIPDTVKCSNTVQDRLVYRLGVGWLIRPLWVCNNIPGPKWPFSPFSVKLVPSTRRATFWELVAIIVTLSFSLCLYAAWLLARPVFITYLFFKFWNTGGGFYTAEKFLISVSTCLNGSLFVQWVLRMPPSIYPWIHSNPIRSVFALGLGNSNRNLMSELSTYAGIDTTSLQAAFTRTTMDRAATLRLLLIVLLQGAY